MERFSKEYFDEGQILLIDKPKTWTSFHVVKKIRVTTRAKKVGHGGTLDPLATGLLIIATGKKTKTLQSIIDSQKEYLVEFKLGATTKTYDAEQAEENICDASHISETDLISEMIKFTGEVEQIPPIFSAVKIKGKSAYKYAREGKKVELKSRIVQIYEFEFIEMITSNIAKARVSCSKGVYIRTLIHDLGQNLGVGAYITELRRTKVGGFAIEDAQTLEDFITQIKKDRI